MNKRNSIRIFVILWLLLGIILIEDLIKDIQNDTLMFRNYFVINLFGGVFCGIIMPVILTISNRIRFNKYVKKTDKTIYYREPPFTYSPVIVTYIENLKIELEKDIIAEICFLKNKGILKIENKNNGYYISRIENIEEDEDKLLESQKYIISKIPTEGKYLNELIEDIRINGNELEKYYENDCIELGYITKGKLIQKINKNVLNIIILILGIVFVFCLIINPIKYVIDRSIISTVKASGAMFIMCLMLGSITATAYTCPIILIFDKIIKLRTPKAAEEYSHWKAFISFLKEYTLINDKKIENIELWEYYLTYAVAFNLIKIKDI